MDLIGLAASLFKLGVSKKQLDGRYSRRTEMLRVIPAGCTFAGLGDSITRGDSAGTSSVNHGATFLAQAAALLGLCLTTNAGEPGYRTDQIKALIPTRLDPWLPQLVHYMAGTNDMGENSPNTVPVAFGHWRETIEILQSKGCTVIVGSLLPLPSTAVRAIDGKRQVDAAKELRKLQKDYCRKNGILYVDYYQSLINPASATLDAWGSETFNGISASYSADNIHPTSPTGHHRMGQILAAALRPRMEAGFDLEWTTRTAVDDPQNCIAAASAGAGNARGYFFDTDENGYPDGWTSSLNTMTGHTSSIETDSNGVRWWVVDVPTSASGTFSYVYVCSLASLPPRGFSVDERVCFAIRFKASGCRVNALAGVKVYAFIQTTAGGSKFSPLNAMIDAEEGLMMMEATLPASLDRVYVYVNVVTSGGTRDIPAQVKLARPAVWNKTRLGLA